MAPRFIDSVPIQASYPNASSALAPSGSTTDIYLGNGCFWERQWAYYVVETTSTAFRRSPASFSAKVGYAGGRTVGTEVCYRTGDERDYDALGHAEAVRVTLNGTGAAAAEQMRALARDFFDSFSGPAGGRARPDPMDEGTPYRSFAGFPGGMGSPLYTVFAKQNTFGMDLKAGSGSDADELNTVWIYDTAAHPFYDGEVYHQHHCNFFASAGMPYPESYTGDLWNELRRSGKYVPTGCPEGVLPHPGGSCSGALLLG